MRIQAVLQTIGSKLDVNGNTYHAFRYTDCAKGATVEALADSESAILAAANSMPHGAAGYAWFTKELPKRLFMQEVRDWKYAGCSAEEIKRYIQEQLARAE